MFLPAGFSAKIATFAPKHHTSVKFSIVIPAHNEASFLPVCLQSLVDQSLPAAEILIVDDHSTDDTAAITDLFAAQYPNIRLLSITSHPTHQPGSKVVQAFNKGYEALEQDFDVICKFDADLIFPPNYLETLAKHFESRPEAGMVGGFCYIEKEDYWHLESLTNKDHIRGALKAYRKACFEAIGGLRSSMGWDTADELLAQYYHWEVVTDQNLHVKHLRPTGTTYSPQAKRKQGQAFYKLRYGFLLSLIASAKLAMNKGQPSLLKDYLQGYFQAKKEQLPFLVNEKQGAFIRKLRYKKMREKFIQ